ncbi:hypothetical protein EVAR_49586_1 [Eumeta japonica]|uniref:Uncharacterized protein n=1 Tax=Eumeta variegata TaxID=151549 RepID=A0A4C1ZWR6_EUMVA|nr:hypothetical protein EVAR_49586_1 [Eumeta japonica]
MRNRENYIVEESECFEVKVLPLVDSFEPIQLQFAMETVRLESHTIGEKGIFHRIDCTTLMTISKCETARLRARAVTQACARAPPLVSRVSTLPRHRQSARDSRGMHIVSHCVRM